MADIRIFTVLLLAAVLIISIYPVTGEATPPLVLIIVPSERYDTVSLSVLEQKADEYAISYQLVTPNGSLLKDSPRNGHPPISLHDISDSYTNQSEISLIVLGGAGYKDLADNQDLLTLLHNWSQNGHLIGAIGQAPAVLGKAGILKNISATILPENNLIKIISDSGARYVNTPGVLTDSIITAGNSKDAENFAEAVFRRTIAHKVSSESGILYLGDTPSGSSLYCIPGEVNTPKINAISNDTVIPDWNGTPFIYNASSELPTIETGIEEWVLMYDSAGGVCVLSDPFSGISIPYGTIQMVQTDQLGEKRDFSTVSGNVSDLFPHSSFREILRSSPELDQSNNSMKEWTDEINTTNKTISDSLGDLFDDIGIKIPIWNGLSATICVKGRLIHGGEIDIRMIRDDPTSSILNSKGLVKSDSCTDILLNREYEPGTSAYIILTGDGNLIVADLKITLPSSF